MRKINCEEEIISLGMVLLTLLQPLAIAADELVDLTKRCTPMTIFRLTTALNLHW